MKTLLKPKTYIDSCQIEGNGTYSFACLNHCIIKNTIKNFYKGEIQIEKINKGCLSAKGLSFVDTWILEENSWILDNRALYPI